MSKYDVVYHWVGGREEGRWHEVHTVPEMAEERLAEVRRMGYVAHRGVKSIGAPEGPPSDADFRAIGM